MGTCVDGDGMRRTGRVRCNVRVVVVVVVVKGRVVLVSWWKEVGR